MACNQTNNRAEHKLWFECGFNPQDAVFEIDDGRVEREQSFVLNRVVVNASQVHHPIVKLDFSCIIFFEAEDEQGFEHEVEVDLLFKLIRTHEGHSECVQTWRYLNEIDVEGSIQELELEISDSFAFSYCDRPCARCCEYRVVVEGRDFEGEFDALRVTQPELTAFVQGIV